MGRNHWSFGVGIAVLLGCIPVADGKRSVNHGEGRELGKFRNTWYCLALESEHPDSPKDQNIYKKSGDIMAVVHEKFKKDLRIEGSGELADGRVINFNGVSEDKKEHFYRVTPNPYGDGVGNCALVPFHTIAVDPDYIPLGSLVRIPETEGMQLPDGTLHDGLWRAEDIGSAIKKDRIDLYVGPGHAGGKTLERHGIKNLQALTVELVEEGSAEGCVHQDPPSEPTL